MKPLTDDDLLRFAIKYKIPDFRGVFMRDSLPEEINRNEAGIVNLDSSHNPGTHWVCYRKREREVDYYDSFGNLRPPVELVRYFHTSKGRAPVIRYNYRRDQDFDTVVCGHLCLQFLLKG